MQLKPKQIKRKSFKALKKENDNLFRSIIRKRDLDAMDRGHCCTCGKLGNLIDTFNPLEVGHFKKRANLLVRWDLRNSHMQCKTCNQIENQSFVDVRYLNFMLKKYGAEEVERIEQLARLTTQEHFGFVESENKRLKEHLKNENKNYDLVKYQNWSLDR